MMMDEYSSDLLQMSCAAPALKLCFFLRFSDTQKRKLKIQTTMSEDRQIQTMIDFIEREAQEKVEEILQTANEEYDQERMRLLEAEKQRVRADCDRKRKNVEIQQRVNRANAHKEQRLRIMQERGTILETLRGKTKEKLLAIQKDEKKYKPLLQGFLRQSLSAIRSSGFVFCCKKDEHLMKEIIPQEVALYNQSHAQDKIDLSLSKQFLEAEMWGGCIVRSTDGKIVCNNTLSYRMDHCFGEQLPTIRYLLFDEEPRK